MNAVGIGITSFLAVDLLDRLGLSPPATELAFLAITATSAVTASSVRAWWRAGVRAPVATGTARAVASRPPRT
jgi:hypothetical protein